MKPEPLTGKIHYTLQGKFPEYRICTYDDVLSAKEWLIQALYEINMNNMEKQKILSLIHQAFGGKK